MSLHLVELPLSLPALNRWAGPRSFSRGVFDEGLALHHLLGEVFGPAALQPFRLMVAPRTQQGTVYAYASRPAAELRRDAQAVLGPAHADVVTLEALRSLPRPAEGWREGQRLGFDVRLRPVVRLAKAAGGFAKGAEIDAFLAEALRSDAPRAREAVYLDWLAQRLAPAARLDPDASRLHAFQRSTVTRNGRRLEGPEVIIHGTLTITDTAAFGNLLARGIGRHRSYGFGMLLLRPPQRAG
ncbi:type I-E CRISPR-associated protein Cas6/Cse3/CasE [Paracoccus sp. (in: a-proteobacteria)]|uniref:type I-E CRISPR-associated protein Cas6/Cse3/CasE n=1 Tax=Paracoccus sp. TaxID=267 RepID=UPI0032207AEA